jgi:peptide/nickel transport system ATP-binding protein
MRPSVVPALRIAGYDLSYLTQGGPRAALAGIDIEIAAGETLGLVGASGSGKTSLAWSILRMLPSNAREGGGRIELAGEDLRAMTRRRLATLRGKRIGMVFQDPSTALNPSMRLGKQVMEVLVRHRRLSPTQAAAEAERWLARTGLPDPSAIMRRYPHQVSGGEKQRVVIASAFACQPDLIILDEPTTALDVVTGARILDLFEELRAAASVACLYISHDLPLVARVADRVAVLEAGRIVEQGPAQQVLRAPQAAQTRRLLDAVPDPAHRLVADRPPTAPLLALDHVGVTYGRTGRIGRWLGAPAPAPGATDVSLTVGQGEILGIVGESGSGKSTLARALCGIAPFTGHITFASTRLGGQDRMSRAWHRDVQIIFQNPDASLNPRHRIATILSRPLRLYGNASPGAVASRVAGMLEDVGLPAGFASRHPHELSGGEKQRVAIARAFAATPKLVICDEVTSALDVVVQTEIVRLLVGLQARHGTAFLFITHDLNLVRQIAHRVAVMYRGRLVDVFEAAHFASAERHPYTKTLLAAVARLDGPVGEQSPPSVTGADPSGE